MATARKISQTASRPRTIADRYELERLLGQGGGGAVYLARDLRGAGEEHVALKLIDTKKSQDPLLSTALQNEFAALSLLRHRNLARVFDFGMTDQEMYITSEWIEGQDIVHACESADLNTVFRLLVEVLRGVDYLHQRGILHLDLKPANILVVSPGRNADGCVKIIDFGLAHWDRHGMRGQGDFSGTPPYAAPEVILGSRLGPASDLYSLGMLFHRLFARRFPFPTQDPTEILRLQIYGNPERVTDLLPALPESFSDLLHRLVAQDPSRRFASVSELMAAINASLEERFSLRSPTAPAEILEESDYFFRKDLIQELRRKLCGGEAGLWLLNGKQGFGKTRLLTRIKELLQLEGFQPMFFSDAKSAALFLAKSESSPPPLLLDLPETSQKELQPLIDLLKRANSKALVASNFETDNATTTVSLEPLTPRQISDFFTAEFKGFTSGHWEEPISRISEGNPRCLEHLLQAMREAGWLQWSDQGWSWQAGPEASPETSLETLLQEDASRWAERRSYVLEILSLVSIGLSAEALAGLLGMEMNTLESRLQAWVKAGLLQAKGQPSATLYFINLLKTGARGSDRKDWKKIGSELESMYQRGEFEAGACWAEWISTQVPEVGELPYRLRLFGARNLLAAGRTETALRFLPAEPDPSGDCLGLHWEVTARTRATQNQLDLARQALGKAASVYQGGGDAAGLSRVETLRGWLQKKMGNNEAAVAAFQRAADFAAEAQDAYGQGLAEMNLGTIYHDQGKLEAAREIYDRAAQHAARARHPLLQLKLKQNRVNLCYTMGRASDAERTCYELLQLAIQNHFPEEQAAALNYLSLFAGQRGDHERQRLYLDQSLSLLQTRPTSPLLPQLYFNRGHLNWDTGKYPAALLDTEAAWKSAEQQSNRFMQSWSLLLKGKILRDRPKCNLDEAQKCLQNAQTMMQQQDNSHLLWEVAFDQGLLAKKRGDFEVAQRCFREARSQLETLLPKLPEGQRQSYLRDRKLEKINEELKHAPDRISIGHRHL